MKPKKRLAIVTSHPIQYNAPLFKLMNEVGSTFTIKVFYTWSQSQEKVFDKEFGFAFDWDIPLLDGYEYMFVENVSKDPGTHHFNGIINPELNEQIEMWKADALLVFRWSFLSHLKAMRHFHGRIPVLFRGDSTLLDEPAGLNVRKLIRRISLRLMYRYIDFALYVGSASKCYFKAHGLKPQQLIFSPHAIDNKRFSNDNNNYTQRSQEWRSALGISERDLVFLFAGKLTKKKDPELLIRSFLALNKPHTWLLLVGNGALENQLKERYKSYANIIFIDFQNQSVMPIVYRVGDVFVLPSMGPGETWGLAINEAMACGRAVIASDKCGCSGDLIINGKNGFVFENGNEDSLETCMKKAVQNFKELGKNSAAIIQEYSYSKTVDQLDVFFENKYV